MRTVMFRNWKCNVVARQYGNGRPALQLVDAEDGSPIAVATVNLPDRPCPEGHAYVKDYSENEGMLDALVAAGVVADTGIRAATGFVQVPLVKIL